MSRLQTTVNVAFLSQTVSFLQTAGVIFIFVSQYLEVLAHNNHSVKTYLASK